MTRSTRSLLIVAVFAACSRSSSSSSPGPAEPSPPEIDCEPGRCLDDISQIIGVHRPEARACYDAARKTQPGLPGALVINFEIDASGTVVTTSQGVEEGQLDDPDVVECVTAVVRRIQFAKSAAGKSTRGYHRFEFSPR